MTAGWGDVHDVGYLFPCHGLGVEAVEEGYDLALPVGEALHPAVQLVYAFCAVCVCFVADVAGDVAVGAGVCVAVTDGEEYHLATPEEGVGLEGGCACVVPLQGCMAESQGGFLTQVVDGDAATAPQGGVLLAEVVGEWQVAQDELLLLGCECLGGWLGFVLVFHNSCCLGVNGDCLKGPFALIILHGGVFGAYHVPTGCLPLWLCVQIVNELESVWKWHFRAFVAYVLEAGGIEKPAEGADGHSSWPSVPVHGLGARVVARGVAAEHLATEVCEKCLAACLPVQLVVGGDGDEAVAECFFEYVMVDAYAYGEGECLEDSG